MKNSKKWFTLVELLVVITILAIISVVAYQSFSWATDKANASRKLQDVTTIESWLQQYFANNNFYPPVDLIDTSKNKYWYDKAQVATPSNTLTVTKTWVEIKEVNTATGWGKMRLLIKTNLSKMNYFSRNSRKTIFNKRFVWSRALRYESWFRQNDW